MLIADSNADEVFAITPAPACQLVEQYDTLQWGTDAPTGIAANLSTGEVFHTDSTDDTIYVSDSSGVLSGQYSYDFVTGALGAGTPQDITYIPSAGNLAVLDNSLDEVVVMNSAGLPGDAL